MCKQIIFNERFLALFRMSKTSWLFASLSFTPRRMRATLNCGYLKVFVSRPIACLLEKLFKYFQKSVRIAASASITSCLFRSPKIAGAYLQLMDRWRKFIEPHFSEYECVQRILYHTGCRLPFLFKQFSAQLLQTLPGMVEISLPLQLVSN